MSDKETMRLPEMSPAPAPAYQTPDSDDKLWAALSYITQVIVPILVPVVLLVAESNRKRDFQKYHAVHSLTLFAVAVIYELLATLVYTVLSAVSLGCLACILWPIFLAPLVPFIYYAYLSYQGQYFEVPYLTRFLREQKWL
jgi:uncharacterized membrane protein